MIREYTWETYDEILLDFVKRFKNIRKRKGITQKKLSEISSVSYASIKRFEQSGEISLSSLTKLLIAMNLQGEIKNLLSNVKYQSIEEIINGRKINK